MFGQPTGFWNRIAKTEMLESEFGRTMFSLDEEKMEEALGRASRSLRSLGLNPEVSRAFLEIAPLLKEHNAITRCRLKYGWSSMPEIQTVDEAMSYLTKEVPGISREQANLARKLLLDLK